MVRTKKASARTRSRPRIEHLENRTLLDAGSTPGPQPAPGILDSAFGANGVATLSIGSGFTDGYLNAVAVQADGKIVAVGFVNTSSSGAHPDFLVARFEADGAPDPAFGVGGFITPNFGDYVATSVAVQADGKILVTGGVTLENSAGLSKRTSFFLARFDANGSLDLSFGIGGVVQTAISAAGDSTSTVLLQQDGKIVVVGDGSNALPATYYSQGPLELVRLNANGSLDPSFGTGGIASVAGVSVDPGNSSAVIQPDGKILVIGRPDVVSGAGNWPALPAEVMRFNSDGNLDRSFGSAGVVLFPNVDNSPYFDSNGAEGLAIQPDGKILVSAAGIFADSALLARLNSDGSLDASFGNDGEVRAAFAGSVAIQPDGQIAVDGWLGLNSNLEIPDTALFGFASYLPDGQIDSEIKTDRAPSLPGSLNWISTLVPGMASQADGKLIVAGFVVWGTSIPMIGQPLGGQTVEGNESSAVPALARILPDPPSQASQLFVTHLYEDLLGRAPDSDGLNAWASSLDQGRMTQSQIVAGFLQSAEYHSHTIQALYVAYLHRVADPIGLAFWSDYLAAGGTSQMIALNLLGSPEYVRLHGGTVGDVVAALFQDLLGRKADPGGALAWGLAIQEGVPVEVVAGALFESKEGAGFEVDSLFEQFLGRPPDSAGSQFFVDALQAGAPVEQIVTDLVSSPEYLTRSRAQAISP